MRKIFVIAGPSGAGKGTVIEQILPKDPGYAVAISHTSRLPRAGEKDKKHYYFVEKADFEQKIKENFFIEYENVHGNYYGTSKQELEKLLASGKTVFFDIDVRGALSIKKIYPEAVLIFLNAPSEETLLARLKKRGSETAESLQKRLETMRTELPLADKFDYNIINDDLNTTVKTIENIIKGAH